MNESDTAPDPPGTIGSRADERSAVWHGAAVGIAGLRERVKTIRVPALTVVATLLLLLAGLATCRLYAVRRLGWIELTNDGPPLLAQVLSEAGDRPLGEPFHVTARSTVALPAGDYRLRVHGAGRLGRTYRFAVNRGETQSHALSLDEGRLLGGEPVPRMGNEQKPREEPIPFTPNSVAIALTPAKSDLIEWTGQTVIRRDGQTGKPIWDSSRPPIPWKTDEDSAEPLRRWLEPGRMAELVQPAPDLDGDDIGDLVWYSRNMNSLLTMSGRNGSVLWEKTLDLDGPGATPPDEPGTLGPVSAFRRLGSLVETPAVADLDRDGTPDLVVTVVFYELPIETERRSPSAAGAQDSAVRNQPALARRVIQAISGQTGQSLWSHPIDPTFTAASYPAWSRRATMVPGRPPATMAYIDGAQWIGLDPATGKPRGRRLIWGLCPSDRSSTRT